MTGVETVNLSGANKIRFTAQPEDNNESKQQSVKKYFTAPNVILGSLATVGVLGMADVLICKGKHLNKLTGKGKALEEALEKATTAEAKLHGTEAKLEEMLAASGKDAEKIKALKEQIAELKTKIPETGSIENLKVMLNYLRNLYIDCQDFGPEVTKYIQNGIKQKLNVMGYKMVKPTDLKFKKFSDMEFKKFYAYEHASINNIDVTKPAIVDAKNNVVMQGHCFVPEKM